MNDQDDFQDYIFEDEKEYLQSQKEDYEIYGHDGNIPMNNQLGLWDVDFF